MNTQWVEWVQEVTDGASNGAIAARIGVARSNVSHWMNDGIPAHAVILIATNFGGDLTEGFIAAGYLRAEHTRCLGWRYTVGQIPAAELLAELRKRQRLIAS